MNVITWGQNPWGLAVPVHIAWWLLWASLVAGMAFVAAHGIWVYFRSRSGAPAGPVPLQMTLSIPEMVPRHSIPARIFHWVMAAAVLTLLFSAFLPKAGLHFSWVNIHWAAGVVLILAVAFHIVHSLFMMDFWSIWPGKADLRAGWRGALCAFGRAGPIPEKPGKYPPGNKLYHLAAAASGLCLAITGMLMMFRVDTPFFTRNPYLLDDMTWGIVYLLHGFAGVALIALVLVHACFALRPENLPVMKAMIFGAMNRRYFLEHYDPQRWTCEGQALR